MNEISEIMFGKAFSWQFKGRKRINGHGRSHANSYWEPMDAAFYALKLFESQLLGKTFSYSNDKVKISWTPQEADFVKLIIRGKGKNKSRKNRLRIYDDIAKGRLSSASIKGFDHESARAIKIIPKLFENPLYVVRNKNNNKLGIIRKIDKGFPFWVGVEFDINRNSSVPNSFYVRRNVNDDWKNKYEVIGGRKGGKKKSSLFDDKRSSR